MTNANGSPATTPKVAPGTLALDFIRALDYTGRTNVGRQRFVLEIDANRMDVLADLRALMARAEAAEAEAARLRAALRVFVDRSARMSESPDPLHCIYEADVTRAELLEARAALTAHGAQDGGSHA